MIGMLSQSVRGAIRGITMTLSSPLGKRSMMGHGLGVAAVQLHVLSNAKGVADAFLHFGQRHTFLKDELPRRAVGHDETNARV